MDDNRSGAEIIPSNIAPAEGSEGSLTGLASVTFEHCRGEVCGILEPHLAHVIITEEHMGFQERWVRAVSSVEFAARFVELAAEEKHPQHARDCRQLRLNAASVHSDIRFSGLPHNATPDEEDLLAAMQSEHNTVEYADGTVELKAVILIFSVSQEPTAPPVAAVSTAMF